MQLTKKQKRDQRENLILLKARKTISEQGIIALKMPVLAQDAEISVGTLYRHFESREDLIAAIAQHALKARCTKLQLTLQVFDLPMQRLIAMPILDFLFNVAHSEAFHTETSCTNSMLWQFASDSRHQGYLQQCEQVSSLVCEVLQPFCNPLSKAQQSNTQDASTGLWSLITGMSYIWYSNEHQQNYSAAVNFFRPHLIRFFQGYFPLLTVTPEEINQVETFLLNNSELWLWKMQGDFNENT